MPLQCAPGCTAVEEEHVHAEAREAHAHAVNDTEWGAQKLDAGEISYAPRGISHRINGDKDFLRFNMYFNCVMRPRIDASAHQRETGIRVDTKSHRELPAYAETKKKLDEAKANNVRPRM